MRNGLKAIERVTHKDSESVGSPGGTGAFVCLGMGAREMPQGLKPLRFGAGCGTAEAVPFQDGLRFVLTHPCAVRLRKDGAPGKGQFPGAEAPLILGPAFRGLKAPAPSVRADLSRT